MLFPVFYQIPDFVQRLYRGVVWRKVVENKKVAYLTFDDGPVPEVTPAVLDILKQYGAKATFFMVGENAVKHPDLLERIRQEGHAVGNHTYNHIKGWQLTTAQYMKNIRKADEVLHTTLFRPPYGRMKHSEKKALLQNGYSIYYWDVLTHDYSKQYSCDKIVAIVKRFTRNGSIITFHDSIKSKESMLQALPQVIQFLQQEGYELITL